MRVNEGEDFNKRIDSFSKYALPKLGNFERCRSDTCEVSVSNGIRVQNQSCLN